MNEIHATDHCASMEQIMSRTMRLIGDTWTLMIIYNLMSGSKRFGELLDALSGISPKTLSQRLKLLEEVEFVERHAYPEIPPRVEYTLTEKGHDLMHIIKAMQDFGQKYLSEESTEEPTSQHKCKWPFSNKSHIK